MGVTKSINNTILDPNEVAIPCGLFPATVFNGYKIFIQMIYTYRIFNIDEILNYTSIYINETNIAWN